MAVVEDAVSHAEPQRESNSLIKRETLLTAFSDDVEVLVETEDQQTADQPLVEPTEVSKEKKSVFTESPRNIPRASYDREYLSALLALPERSRNVAILGPLHSGKTSLVDLLVLQAHEKLPNISKSLSQGWKPIRYTDNTKLEIERGLSCKVNGLTFLGSDLQDKAVALTVLDCPGHVNFIDEVAVSIAASDTCLIVVDVVEGITSVVQQLIRQAEKSQLPMIFVLNKLDRLILELNLPPKEAYLKIRHVVNDIDRFTQAHHSPKLGNILFSSAKLGFTFSIKEFVLRYYAKQLGKKNIQSFIDRMWGDIYFQEGSFSNNPNAQGLTTFAQFILTPLYKIFTHSLSSDPQDLANLIKRHFQIVLPAECLKWDPQPLLRKVLGLVFGIQVGLIDAINEFGISAEEGSSEKRKSFGINADSESVLAHVLKFMDYCGDSWALVRIYQGTVRPNDLLKAIDAGISLEDDIAEVKVEEIALLSGRYVLPLEEAYEGQLVLMKGLKNSLTKSGTLSSTGDVCFPPLDYISEPVFKVIIQPLLPKELPLMVDGLKKVNQFYPGMITCVEESGENMILGTGELYLDCLLYDLRTNYAKVEIQVSSPLVKFAESCTGESFASIPVKGAGGRLSVSVGAQPLERELVKDLSSGALLESEIENPRQLAKKLREKYNWDSLAARNIWSLHNSNVFVDDTLPDEVNKEQLSNIKHQICQGFEWATREGPLAEEAIYGVHFRLLNVTMEDSVNTGQLIPLVRKACYVALLSSQPALLEPIYEVCCVVHDLMADVVEELFSKRRGGRIYNRVKILATPLIEIRGQIPVIDSIGFETDLRTATNSQGMCHLQFCNKIWRKVPGNVLDENAVIPKLKPAPRESMSRDFVMKTRRRKGLSSDGYVTQDGPSLARYIEPELYQRLKENNFI